MGRKSWWSGSLLAAAAVLLGAQLSFGAGFALYEGSARGNALGGTLVGRADDPSALFYNPAGITQLPGVQVMTGATAIIPSTDVKTTERGVTTTTSTESNVWVPPQFYATYQFNDRVWFGLGVFSPFGLGTEFDSNWPGRFNSYKAVIETLTINPNIALKLNDQFSVAAGMEVMWFDLNLRQKINPASPLPPVLGQVDQELSGDSFGYGFNIAMRYQPCQWFALGASYRSQVSQNVEGDAKFDKSQLLINLPYLFNNTDVSGSITLPDMLFFGATFYPIKDLSVEIGGVWNRWSTYNELAITYDSLTAVGRHTVVRPKNWNDTVRFQFGVEYKTTDWLDLRAGYVYDPEPSTDEYADYLVPANDRHLFSFGPGFHWKNWTLDLSYTYLYITDREVNHSLSAGVLPSEFENGNAHLIGTSLSYKF